MSEDSSNHSIPILPKHISDSVDEYSIKQTPDEENALIRAMMMSGVGSRSDLYEGKIDLKLDESDLSIKVFTPLYRLSSNFRSNDKDSNDNYRVRSERQRKALIQGYVDYFINLTKYVDDSFSPIKPNTTPSPTDSYVNKNDNNREDSFSFLDEEEDEEEPEQEEKYSPANRCKFLKAHIPTLVRLATESPFEDIRIAFSDLIIDMKGKGFVFPEQVGCSHFLNKDVIDVNTHNEKARSLFIDLFSLKGRVSHFDRVLAFFPEVLRKVNESMDFILTGGGPLPILDRFYIALMAASVNKCSYLFNEYCESFLLSGGDLEWIKDARISAPPKMMSLLSVMHILAIQPWLINGETLSPLLKSSWSMGELLQALIIICSVDSLSCVILGCGIIPELDFYLDTIEGTDILNNQNNEVFEMDQEEDLIPNKDELTHESKSLFNMLINRQNMNDSDDDEFDEVQEPKGIEGTESIELKGITYEHMNQFGQTILTYKDFDQHINQIMHSEEFTWADHGYSLLKRFYPQVTALLDSEFDLIASMTDRRVNKSTEDVDTSPFRLAIRRYVHQVMGLKHDDYNYGIVNKVLNIGIKKSSKRIVFHPSKINKAHFHDLGYELRPQEKVHIILLVFSARKEAQLLWAFQALLQAS